MTPKISIVTPSFNQAEFLEATMRSVLTQEYEHLEYVVIDGGSTDDSVRIIEKYAGDLHYWISEPDSGHADALNKGFAQTTGEIMAWINSDDMYTPWALRCVAQIFDQFPEVDWIVGFCGYWNKHGFMTHAYRKPKSIYDFLSGDYGWIQQESVFWRRSLWDHAGGYINQNYRLMVDGELWTRFFQHTELVSVDCILSGYRYHPGNRAVQHIDECHAEMRTAISEMERRLDRSTRYLGRAMRVMRGVNRNVFFKSSSLPRVLSGVFPAARYTNIHYHHEQWQKRKLPFSLR